MKDVWVDLTTKAVKRPIRIEPDQVIAMQMLEKGSGERYYRIVIRDPQQLNETILLEQALGEE